VTLEQLNDDVERSAEPLQPRNMAVKLRRPIAFCGTVDDQLVKLVRQIGKFATLYADPA
jgi:hypothetical protein